MNTWLWRFLPTSRKARLILAVLAMGAGLLILKLIFFRPAGMRVPIDEGLVLKLHQEQLEKLREDSDGDGLKNWEELIYQTDVANTDTDGDGTSDGEEIKMDRDPALKGPNDHFATSTPMDATIKDPGTNYTRDFTRTFLRGPVSQIVAGGKAAIDIKAVEQYADKLSQQSVLDDAPRWTAKDIVIDRSNSKKILDAYLESYTNVFDALNGRGENEVDVIVRALNMQDYTPLADIADYPAEYQRAINKLRALRVPERLADSHLTALNTLSQFKRSTELMLKLETDPLLAILALRERVTVSDQFNKFLAQFGGEIAIEVSRTQ
ncbi:MAG: hypothetical protein HYT41_02845 [Candidatus Sungbacteria bacterium]|nr:hypothetical protein [Candidatus Sungbacteria bacterium]